MADLVLSNARVLDGRGGISERATVRLSGGRVADVLPGRGELLRTPCRQSRAAARQKGP